MTPRKHRRYNGGHGGDTFMDGWMTVSQFAAAYDGGRGCSRQWVSYLCNRGRLKPAAVCVEGRYMIRPYAVDVGPGAGRVAAEAAGKRRVGEVTKV